MAKKLHPLLAKHFGEDALDKAQIITSPHSNSSPNHMNERDLTGSQSVQYSNSNPTATTDFPQQNDPIYQGTHPSAIGSSCSQLRLNHRVSEIRKAYVVHNNRVRVHSIIEYEFSPPNNLTLPPTDSIDVAPRVRRTTTNAQSGTESPDQVQHHPNLQGELTRRAPCTNRSPANADGRTHSLPCNKYGPYTCPKCNTVCDTSQKFASHMVLHYKSETSAEKKSRLAARNRKKNDRFCLVSSREGITVMPVPSVNQDSTRVPAQEEENGGTGRRVGEEGSARVAAERFHGGLKIKEEVNP